MHLRNGSSDNNPEAPWNNCCRFGVYNHVKASRYRVTLPLVFGGAAAILMAWDLYNEKIILQMGMGWDTGAPIWPYRTPELLLPAIDRPARFLCAPILWALDRRFIAERYPVLLPFIVIWWHLVGRRLDFGLVPPAWRGAGKAFAVISVFIGFGLACVGFARAIEATKLWSSYVHTPWSDNSFLVVPELSLAIWCFLLAAWLGAVAVKAAAGSS